MKFVEVSAKDQDDIIKLYNDICYKMFIKHIEKTKDERENESSTE